MVDVGKTRRILLTAMFLLALGAFAMHFRIHPPLTELEDGGRQLNFTFLVASMFSLLDVVLVTILFSRKQTVAYAYLLNGMLVIYGTVFMAHCGIAKAYSPETSLLTYIFSSTFPQIILVWADFFLGATLYRMWFMEPPRKAEPAAQPAG